MIGSIIKLHLSLHIKWQRSYHFHFPHESETFEIMDGRIGDAECLSSEKTGEY